MKVSSMKKQKKIEKLRMSLLVAFFFPITFRP